MTRTRQMVSILLFALLLLPPMIASTTGVTSASPSPEAGWVTLVSEDFEGAFPRGQWHIGREGDPYLWGQRNCNPHGGAYSMWGGGGGSLGAQAPCSSMYTTGYVTTLSYGPLDLSGCSALRVNFSHWTMLGAGDSLGVGYSNDGGASWQILPIYGNAVSVCGGWCQESFSQDDWSIPLCGRTSVYLLFRFASDVSEVSYGTFVDDVLLEAYYASVTSTATATATSTPSVTPTATRTTTPTATQTPVASRRFYLPLVRKP